MVVFVLLLITSLTPGGTASVLEPSLPSFHCYSRGAAPGGESHPDAGQDELVLFAVVTSIDYQHHRVTLETELGHLVVMATPAVLQTLQEGDVIAVAVEKTDVAAQEALCL
ncbi:MAG: hypothetical protein AB1671_26570 [Thermodesulfobacteriota bacterium]